MQGATFEELMLSSDYIMTMAKYSNYVKQLCFIFQRDRAKVFRDLTVQIYWGATGTGKTRTATEEFPDNFLISKDTQTVWFDGYSGESVLIWDDFHWDDVKIQFLLRLLDGYALRLPVKGSFTWAQYRRVIITSNIPPQLWYDQADPAHVAALKRRITEIREFK